MRVLAYAEDFAFNPAQPRDERGRWTDIEGYVGPAFSETPTDAVHYGDGGAARDTLRRNMSGGRSTGHFGTGVYFLSGKAGPYQPGAMVGNMRGVKYLDLTGLKMARGSEQLHRGLRQINAMATSVKKGDLYFDNMLSRGHDAAFLTSLSLGIYKPDKVNALRRAIRAEVEAERNGWIPESEMRSASTRVMQRLGYDGVDSRGTALDNSDYGSVVYIRPVRKGKPLAFADEEGSVFVEGEEGEYIFVWDEGKHPRFPKGHPRGGEWMSKGPVYNRKKDKWVDENYKPISKAVAKRMAEIGVINRDLYNLRLNPDTKSGLVAVARDALRTEKFPMGRVVYIRTKEHIGAATHLIHARGKDFDKIMPKLQSRLLKDLRNTSLDRGTRDSAAVLYFVTRTGMRIGSGVDRGAAVKGYGANTLEMRHLTLVGKSGLEFKFMGLKKGGMKQFKLDDLHLASYLQGKEYYSLKDPLFGAPYAKVNSYFKEVTGGKFKIKDARTWTATSEALKMVEKMPAPKNAKQFKEAKRKIAKEISERLGNTPAMALNFYINPAVFSKWEMK